MNLELEALVTELRRQGLGLREIADSLNDGGHQTATGAEYRAKTVWRMANRTDPRQARRGTASPVDAMACLTLSRIRKQPTTPGSGGGSQGAPWA